MADKILIPDQMYLGTIWRENDVPLGFLTPDSGDAASNKRKQTVDNWVSSNQGYRSTIKVKTCNIPNQLLSGFRLTKTQRRWTTSNVVWRVVDPRGFEIEISSENLMNLLSDTTIINGEILGRLIYGRSGSNNILLHENSEEYVNAVELTSVNAKMVDISSIGQGSMVILHSGEKLRYMGKFYTIVSENVTDKDNELNEYKLIKVSDKKSFIFIDDEKKKIKITSSKPKIGKVIEHADYTDDIVLSTVYAMIAELKNKHTIDSLGRGYLSYDVIGITNIKDISYEYEQEFVDINEIQTGDLIGKLFVESDGKFYYTNYLHKHSIANGTQKLNLIELDMTDKSIKFIKTLRSSPSYHFYRDVRTYTTKVDVNWNDLPNKKLFYIKVNIFNNINSSVYLT